MSTMNGIVEHLGRETIKSYENFGEWLKDHDKQIRADAIDECIKALKGYGECDLADKITLLEELKEQK